MRVRQAREKMKDNVNSLYHSRVSIRFQKLEGEGLLAELPWIWNPPKEGKKRANSSGNLKGAILARCLAKNELVLSSRRKLRKPQFCIISPPQRTHTDASDTNSAIWCEIFESLGLAGNWHITMSVSPRRESHELDRVLKLSLEAVALYKDLLAINKLTSASCSTCSYDKYRRDPCAKRRQKQIRSSSLV